jgi:lipid-A-disaccharide synthase-like uncharacterized protein
MRVAGCVQATGQVVSFASIPRVLERLGSMLTQLESCQRALNEFLEDKRAAFPRCVGDKPTQQAEPSWGFHQGHMPACDPQPFGKASASCHIHAKAHSGMWQQQTWLAIPSRDATDRWQLVGVAFAMAPSLLLPCCRFYFLGDDDLLEVLGQGASLAVVQSHLKKLFAGIHRVREEQHSQQHVL